MKKVVILSILSILLFPAMLFAADFRVNESGNVNIQSDDKAKNLYTAGNTINSDANITGDMVVAGNTININGDIENSLAAAGNTINLKGNIGQNARIAGATINVNGTIGQDLLIGGATISIGENAVIKNDLLIAGSTIEISGKVYGDVKIAGAEKLIIKGEILGNLDANNIQNLTIESSAIINGKLTYSAAKEGTIANKDQIKGGVSYKKVEKAEKIGNDFTSIVGKMILSFITLFVLVYLAPKFSQNVVENAYKNPWANIGFGLVFLIVTPIIGLMLAISVLGIKIAMLLVFLYILFLVIAGLFSSILAGSLLLKLIDRSKAFTTTWRAIAIGVIAITIASYIPVIGWIIVFVFFLLGLGELIQRSISALKIQRN